MWWWHKCELTQLWQCHLRDDYYTTRYYLCKQTPFLANNWNKLSEIVLTYKPCHKSWQIQIMWRVYYEIILTILKNPIVLYGNIYTMKLSLIWLSCYMDHPFLINMVFSQKIDTELSSKDKNRDMKDKHILHIWCC